MSSFSPKSLIKKIIFIFELLKKFQAQNFKIFNWPKIKNSINNFLNHSKVYLTTLRLNSSLKRNYFRNCFLCSSLHTENIFLHRDIHDIFLPYFYDFISNRTILHECIPWKKREKDRKGILCYIFFALKWTFSWNTCNCWNSIKSYRMAFYISGIKYKAEYVETVIIWELCDRQKKVLKSCQWNCGTMDREKEKKRGKNIEWSEFFITIKKLILDYCNCVKMYMVKLTIGLLLIMLCKIFPSDTLLRIRLQGAM